MRQWLDNLPASARNLLLSILGVISIALLWLLLAIVGFWIEGVSRSSDAKSMIERLRGYAEVESELEALVSTARSELRQYALSPSISADQASANLQRDLRDYARRAALTVVGSQAMEEATNEELPGFERLAVQLNFNGPPLSIDQFLQKVATHQPALLVESMSIVKPPSRGRTRGSKSAAVDDKLNVRVVVSALREI